MKKAKSELNISFALDGIGSTLTSSLKLEKILIETCKTAVETFGVNHSGLVLFDTELKQGKVESEYPAWNMIGKIIPLRGIPAEGKLIKLKKPQMVVNVSKRKSLGSVGALLMSYGIKSILLIPVVSKSRILGSFSLDVADDYRKFTDREIESCRVFAERVAVAIENAQLYQEAKQQVGHLEILRDTTLAISSIANRDILLKTIIKKAVRLLKAKSGGIYEYLPEENDLVVIADHNRPKQIGKILKAGEGAAGYLVKTRKPYIIVHDYNAWSGRAKIYKNKRLFESVIEVPLCWRDKIIGVIYVDDKAGRKFTKEDAHWLGLFADQAAIALVNSGLIARDKAKVMRLEKLSRAITEIMGVIRKTNLDNLLTLIAKNAVDILDAEVCGVHLVKRKEFLSLEASYGHRKGGFKKGKEFAIISGQKTGLTGHIAFEGKTFNSYGTELVNHFAVRGLKPIHLPSGRCYSLLAIPLKTKKHTSKELIGLLRIENKKQNGQASPLLRFDDEDEWVLSIFAEAVVVAIENAKLVEQLNEQTDHQTRLFASSPDCVIAIDRNGSITDYNERAQNILGYTKEEVLNKQVEPLFRDPKEPRRVGKKLHLASDGRLTNYETHIKAKDGEIIPIRLSATWLYNAEKQLIGSVGYFEDLRSAQETDRVHHAAQTVARVSTRGNLDNTLEAIVKGARSALNCDISTLYTFDEESRSFVHAKGVGCQDPSQMTPPDKITKKSDLWKIVDLQDPYFHVAEDVFDDEILRGRFVHSEGVGSAIGIQLRCGQRRVGVLFIDRRKPHQFSEAEINNARYFGNQAAIAIWNAQLLQETKRQANLLKSLYPAVTSSRPLDITLKFIAKRALRLSGIESDDFGFSHIALLDETLLRFKVAWPPEYLPGLENGIGDIDLKRSENVGVTGRAVIDARTINIENVKKHPDYISFDQSTLSELVVPIRYKNKVIGVINVERKDNKGFGKDDERALEYLATQAAIAIQIAKQSEETQHNAKLRKGLLQIGKAIMSLRTPHRGLQTLVDGIKRVLDCDLVILYTFDQKSEELGIAMVAGELFGSENLNDISQGSVVRKLLKKGNARFGSDSINDEILNPGGFVDRQSIRSSAGIPLLIGKEPVGIVFVNYRKNHRFKPQEQGDLQLFATQAAMAIGNMRLFEAAERRARNLGAVLKVSQTVNSSLELEQILVKACKAIVELLRINHSALVLFDDESGKGEIKAEYPDIGTKGSIIPVRGIPAEEHLILHKEPYVINDVASELALDPAREILTNVDTSAVMLVPIISRGRVIGSLGLDVWSDLRKFTEEEVDLCKVFAAQVAFAIENARLFNMARQKAEDLHTVLRVSQTVISSLNLDHILDAACQAVVKLLKVDHAGLVLFEPTLEKGVVQAEYPEVGVKGTTFPVRGVPAEERLIKTKRPLIITDVVNDSSFDPVRSVLSKLGTQSILIIPILSKGKLLGSFGLDATKYRRSFSPEEIEIGRAFAAQVAPAIENARQYEELKQTKGLVGSRTALAWVGMASGTWGHTIKNYALTINEQTDHIMRELNNIPGTDSLTPRLEMVKRLSSQISEKIITPPLSEEEGASSVPINDLIRERISSLQDHEEYQQVTIEQNLYAGNRITTRASAEWLKRALDILIENSVDATLGMVDRRIVISTTENDGVVRISITDNGKGIPKNIHKILLKAPIKKKKGQKGLGLGLLFGQMILQTYGGEIKCQETSLSGTTMVISLPIEFVTL